MVSFSSGVVESPARYMAGLGALVQWYPGHIAKAEKALKDQSKVVDMLIGTRDARLSLATCLPQPCSAAVPTCKKEKSSNLTSVARAAVKGVEGAVESPVRYMGASGPLVQWYPGHIAKAEKALKDQLKMVDVVIEVRDARIPLATCHPEIDFWIGEKTKIVVLNREDMISTADKNAWGNYFANCGISPIFTDSRFGSGTMKVVRTSKSVATAINARRQAKGLLPRAVRAAVVGYPNVGKSSLINRILRRRKCEVAPKPGVTRVLKWVRLGEDLDLLDSPGILPMRIDDQTAAVHLAICNDIGEASYATEGVAAYLVEILKQMPTAGSQVLSERYKMEAENLSGQMFLEELGQKLFAGDINQAAYRVLRDFRKGSFGSIALELPPNSSRDS